MATVLSPLSGSNYNNALLLSGLQTQYGGRIAAKTASIESDYGTKLGAVDRHAQQWKDFRAELEKPRSIVSGVVGRLKGIRALLDSLSATVGKANLDSQSGTLYDGYRATFNSLLKSLRSRIDNTADSPNLLGKTGARELLIPTDISGAPLSVRQNYKGIDYRILDTSGFQWAPDYVGNLLRRYDSYPDEPSSVSGNLANGVRLDSLSGDDVTFTVAPDTASPQTVDGTIDRGGIGLVDAWFYDNLSTQDGRDRALADLKAAKNNIDQEIGRYQRTLTSIAYYDSRAEIRLGDFSQETGALLIERERAVLTSQENIQRQFDLATTALARNQFALNVYKNMFATSGNTVANRVFGTIVSTNA
jgi:hypothetical protein